MRFTNGVRVLAFQSHEEKDSKKFIAHIRFSQSLKAIVDHVKIFIKEDSEYVGFKIKDKSVVIIDNEVHKNGKISLDYAFKLDESVSDFSKEGVLTTFAQHDPNEVKASLKSSHYVKAYNLMRGM